LTIIPSTPAATARCINSVSVETRSSSKDTRGQREEHILHHPQSICRAIYTEKVRIDPHLLCVAGCRQQPARMCAAGYCCLRWTRQLCCWDREEAKERAMMALVAVDSVNGGALSARLHRPTSGNCIIT
jgi:hypothetical protein